jgi:hypothetical protein
MPTIAQAVRVLSGGPLVAKNSKTCSSFRALFLPAELSAAEAWGTLPLSATESRLMFGAGSGATLPGPYAQAD